MLRYKNVIFDFGNVLIHFSPENMVRKYVSDPDDAVLLTDTVFSRLLWDKLDVGSITDSECKLAFSSALPERLHETAFFIYDKWIDNLPEVDGMRELVVKLKECGCRVFVLSNISSYFSENRDRSPILALFDGVVLSSDIGLVKPDAAIFDYICDKFSISREDTLFVDDNCSNIESAESLGFHTWLYKFDTAGLTEHIFGKEI